MTEMEWLACTNVDLLLEHLQEAGLGSPRQRRLLAVAWCRRIGHLLPDERCRWAVEASARFADGELSERELLQAWSLSNHACSEPMATRLAFAALAATWCADTELKWPMVKVVAGYAGLAQRDGWRANCDLVREIFGNPFRRHDIQLTWLGWRDNTLTQLARGIYQERRFADLPLLGDALEEAGCEEADLLTHCRSGASHVPGCWVLESLLRWTSSS